MTVDLTQSLQDQFSPNSKCFGCGPANENGLQIKSFLHENALIAQWQAKSFHEAFPGALNGGIVGTLLDCHCNWMAAYSLMNTQHLDNPPCTVTANYTIQLLKPVPSQQILYITAKLVELKADRAITQGEILLDDVCYAKCHGTFVAVKPGHMAYHRW